MKNLFIKLESINEQINAFETQIENIKKLPYYKIFRLDEERDNDLAEAYGHLKTLLTQKAALLDSMTICVELEKVDVSDYERRITIPKNKLSA